MYDPKMNNKAKWSIDIIHKKVVQGENAVGVPKSITDLVMEKQESKQRVIGSERSKALKMKPYQELDSQLKKNHVLPPLKKTENPIMSNKAVSKRLKITNEAFSLYGIQPISDSRSDSPVLEPNQGQTGQESSNLETLRRNTQEGQSEYNDEDYEEAFVLENSVTIEQDQGNTAIEAPKIVVLQQKPSVSQRVFEPQFQEASPMNLKQSRLNENQYETKKLTNSKNVKLFNKGIKQLKNQEEKLLQLHLLNQTSIEQLADARSRTKKVKVSINRDDQNTSFKEAYYQSLFLNFL